MTQRFAETMTEVEASVSKTLRDAPVGGRG